jgi:hypothetical protein
LPAGAGPGYRLPLFLFGLDALEKADNFFFIGKHIF